MQSSPGVLLEACVEHLEQAVAAERNGADRLELCGRLDLGGLTASFELTEQILSTVHIPIMAMVRPREGDFIYSDAEYDLMAHQILRFKQLSCQGVVFGLLTRESEIDVQRTKELVTLARPMQVTFHKAFDDCPDLFGALEAVKLTGVDRLLTSGSRASAMEAVDTLNQLIEQSKGRPRLIVAGKVTCENIELLRALIPKATEFHGRGIVPIDV